MRPCAPITHTVQLYTGIRARPAFQSVRLVMESQPLTELVFKSVTSDIECALSAIDAAGQTEGACIDHALSRTDPMS
jgi:hypothetical protein